MSLWELFVIAVGLSMDAFAVSICKGLSVGKCKVKHMLICGLYFGAFQAIMPSIGYLLGAQFETLVTCVAPYIAFALLTLIGFNMIRESCSKEEEEEATADFSWHSMLPLAVATSIDALAVGVSFAFLQVNIVPAVLFIGLTAMEKDCDAEVNNICSQMTAILKANGRDTAIVREVKKTYTDKKADKTIQITDAPLKMERKRLLTRLLRMSEA